MDFSNRFNPIDVRAVEAGYRGCFTTADNLCRTLVRASIEGNLASEMKSFTAPTVSVIDDVGLLPIGGTEASAVFFQVVNTRYERGHPTIVTTNRGLPDRGHHLRRHRRRRSRLRPPHAQRHRVQHQRPQLASTRTQRARDRHHQPHRTQAQLTSPTTGRSTDSMSVFTEDAYEPPVWTEQPRHQAKMMHFEVLVNALDAAVQLVTECGGNEALHQPADRDRTRLRIMLDPAGHPFCMFVHGE